MLIEIPFTKASGAGNTFVLIDNRDQWLSGEKSALARALCCHHFGIGADGLLLVEASPKAAFSMRYYNADGSYGGMCGNGGRCIAKYAFLKGIASSQLAFEALDFIYSAEVLAEGVKLHMKNPQGMRLKMSLRLKDITVEGAFISTGSPHFVVIKDSIEHFDLFQFGKEIRNHTDFMPEGTNVNLMKIVDSNTISIRTYERGVEAETLACGTGSVASALVAASISMSKGPMNVEVRSGEILSVDFKRQGNDFTNVSLFGSAKMLFTGKVLYDTKTASIAGS